MNINCEKNNKLDCKRIVTLLEQTERQKNQIGAEQNRSRTRKLVRLATKQNKTKQNKKSI
jgi:hypothetical protein